MKLASYPGAIRPIRRCGKTERHPDTGIDIMVLPIDGSEAGGWKAGTPWPLVRTPAVETSPIFSPDGKWVAYAANDGSSARLDVYVARFPSGDSQLKISRDGGSHPTWSSRQELLFVTPGSVNAIMAVPYTTAGGAFRPEAPRPWSSQPIMLHESDRPYDLHPDGRRAVVIKAPDLSGRDRIVVTSTFSNYCDYQRPQTSVLRMQHVVAYRQPAAQVRFVVDFRRLPRNSR